MKIKSLTSEDTLAIIEEQKKRIEELEAEIQRIKTPPPNDWHSWMDALLHIILYPFKSVKIVSEFKLGVQPPRADFVVISEDEYVDLGLEIFDIFLEHNVIEFKSPGDELSFFTICKGVGYVCFYISVMHEKGIDIDFSQVTLTFIRDKKPEKLLRELSDYVEEGPIEGIYYIKNWMVGFPIQIVHSKVLKGDKYAGFRTISDNPEVEDIEELFRQSKDEANLALRRFYSAYWSISAKLTGDKLEEAKRRNPKMARTIFDIFKPEIDEEINNAVTAHLFKYVQNGGMTVDFAAKEADMDVADFMASMREAGYKVPETA